ncbi:hypothetical protein [Nocardioides jensenii]|uniref:hypothetical protein n=1 Tax=Nocardioides jensenii TaxID=1843 RepID=UPI0012FB5E3D|nr:hypothetical protein [Nocardioides jensenii]
MTDNVTPGAGQPDLRKIALVLVGILVVLIGTAVVVMAVTGGDADSVQEVADAAAEAGEDLDVDAGIDLLCEPPTDEQRDRLDGVLVAGKDEAGTDDPEVHFEVSDVKGDETGSFTLTIWSDDGALKDGYGVADIEVDRDGDRSCIADVDLDTVEGQQP